MAALQVVFDTNVVVAGLRSQRGRSFRLLSLIGRDYFELNISVPLILEYEAVLVRQLPHIGLSRDDVDDVIDYFCQVGTHHRIHFLWRPFLRDPGDEMILELAVKAGCQYIVTFNGRDFAGVDQFGIQALTPDAFLRELGVI